jgi:hypothetical protein
MAQGASIVVSGAPSLCPAALSDTSIDATAHVPAFVFGGEATPASMRAASNGERNRFCVLPLYVLCYIFDEDELNDVDVERSDEETASTALVL